MSYIDHEKFNVFAEDPNAIYYRIMLNGGRISICCLQWFDEYDYDESKWITSRKFDDLSEGDDGYEEYGYSGKQRAIEWLKLHHGRTDLPKQIQVAIDKFFEKEILSEELEAWENILD